MVLLGLSVRRETVRWNAKSNRSRSDDCVQGRHREESRSLCRFRVDDQSNEERGKKGDRVVN